MFGIGPKSENNVVQMVEYAKAMNSIAWELNGLYKSVTHVRQCRNWTAECRPLDDLDLTYRSCVLLGKAPVARIYETIYGDDTNQHQYSLRYRYYLRMWLTEGTYKNPRHTAWGDDSCVLLLKNQLILTEVEFLAVHERLEQKMMDIHMQVNNSKMFNLNPSRISKIIRIDTSDLKLLYLISVDDVFSSFLDTYLKYLEICPAAYFKHNYKELVAFLSAHTEILSFDYCKLCRCISQKLTAGEILFLDEIFDYLVLIATNRKEHGLYALSTLKNVVSSVIYVSCEQGLLDYNQYRQFLLIFSNIKYTNIISYAQLFTLTEKLFSNDVFLTPFKSLVYYAGFRQILTGRYEINNGILCLINSYCMNFIDELIGKSKKHLKCFAVLYKIRDLKSNVYFTLITSKLENIMGKLALYCDNSTHIIMKYFCLRYSELFYTVLQLNYSQLIEGGQYFKSADIHNYFENTDYLAVHAYRTLQCYSSVCNFGDTFCLEYNIMRLSALKFIVESRITQAARKNKIEYSTANHILVVRDIYKHFRNLSALNQRCVLNFIHMGLCTRTMSVQHGSPEFSIYESLMNATLSLSENVGMGRRLNEKFS